MKDEILIPGGHGSARPENEGPKKRARRVSQRRELAVVTLGAVASMTGIGGLLAANPPGWTTAAEIAKTAITAPQASAPAPVEQTQPVDHVAGLRRDPEQGMVKPSTLPPGRAASWGRRRCLWSDQQFREPEPPGQTFEERGGGTRAWGVVGEAHADEVQGEVGQEKEALALRSALQRLPERERRVLVMCYGWPRRPQRGAPGRPLPRVRHLSEGGCGRRSSQDQRVRCSRPGDPDVRPEVLSLTLAIATPTEGSSAG